MAKQRRSRVATSKTARRPGRSTPDSKADAPAKRASEASAADSDARPNKGEKLYYRIGEVAKLTDVKPYVLRYWESEFRWMAPQKSRSKQRLYRRKDIDTILLIKKLLYEERYTIAGARKLLREMGVGGTAEASLAKTLDHRTEYRRIREELIAIRATL